MGPRDERKTGDAGKGKAEEQAEAGSAGAGASSDPPAVTDPPTPPADDSADPPQAPAEGSFTRERVTGPQALELVGHEGHTVDAALAGDDREELTREDVEQAVAAYLERKDTSKTAEQAKAEGV